MINIIWETFTVCAAPAHAPQKRLSTSRGRISVGRNLKMKDGENTFMTVLFLGLNDDGDGWEKLGYVEDGEIREDPTGDLEQLLEGFPDLKDEHRLTRQFNNHYVNAVIVKEGSDENPPADQ
ncbi:MULTISPECIES: hypothetical protein [Halorussus]|uniref:hypothetical protein n=1 Tax=Halorussus TaxID=1070314 RepID=UPI0020A01EED|nr:hypothetical protein [Halorussus vallis]USZ77215.1 hypothetical protein NGM07_07755 [Halorussus vallis]